MADELWQAIQDHQQQLMDPISAFSQSPIKGSFVVHFMLVILALITTDWLPRVFIYYNLVFYVCLLWSLHALHNPEPVQLAAILNLISILLDVMCIATNYEYGHNRSWFGFSLFLLICNLILRPITSIVLLRVYNDRNDRFGTFGAFDARPAGGPFGFGGTVEGAGVAAGSRAYPPGNESDQRTPLVGPGGYEDLDSRYRQSKWTGNQAQPPTSAAPSGVVSTGGYQAVPGPIDSP